jgi:folate-dependent phosphoribosylglycinamide formyltransferase PurN
MKINILVDDDKCWNLNIVRRLIPYLGKYNIKVDHIWILPNKLSNLKGNKISIWYFKTFGITVFLKLSIFYILVLIHNFFNRVNNFKDLALKYDIKYNYINSTNNKYLSKTINRDKKRISLLITNHILKKKLLDKKKHFFINKHSSLLPSYRGLLPYLWTKIDNKDNGITFHLVNEKIDSGKIIFQKKIKMKFNSMIEFYLEIFDRFPMCFLQAIKNLEKKNFIQSKSKKSYFSIPTKEDYIKFLKKKGNVILFSDFLKINKLT